MDTNDISAPAKLSTTGNIVQDVRTITSRSLRIRYCIDN